MAVIFIDWASGLSLSLSLSLQHMCLCAVRCFATIHLQIIAFISYWSTDSFDGLVKYLSFWLMALCVGPFFPDDYILDKKENHSLGVVIDKKFSTWASDASNMRGRLQKI